MSRPKGSKNKPKTNTVVELAENTEIKNLSLDNSIKQEISSLPLIKKGRGRPRKILPGQETESFSTEKPLLKPEDNQCIYKALCLKNIEKIGYNDTCFNPVYCLDNFGGGCNLIIKKPIPEKIFIDGKEQSEKITLPIANIKDIKRQIRELRKLKLDLKAGNPERIKLGRQIKELKKKLDK